MSNFKINLTHEHEEQIAVYCAKNNLEFNQANAYELTLEAFKDTPIIYKTIDRDTGEEVEHTVTQRVARQIECQIKTVDRIADKILLAKTKFDEEQRKNNIKKTKITDKPDLGKLVENLYQLNIVDGGSYLALVCFLMQLKYTRDNRFTEDDKSCVFFNGVGRNGKSSTAKAICDVESQYGEIFCASSAKLLESTHEERVWKSHLNHFDEVKPTDIDRETLLKIVNGGEVELNPKNKRQYVYQTNTNNIFTSNDQINLKQRRISVIKFGDRINGRPLKVGALKGIITEILDSLPDFSRYHEIYNIVSKINEARINPLAIESIITFMTSKLKFVRHNYSQSLKSSIIFAPHDIYNCIKGTYNKQIIVSERKEAILYVLRDFAKRGLIEEVKYNNCKTEYFSVKGENYIKIMEEYDKINTMTEINKKISVKELHDLLLPYFIEPKEYEDTEEDNELPKEDKPVPESESSLVCETIHDKGPMFIPEETYFKGRNLFAEISCRFGEVARPEETMSEDLLHDLMTEEACLLIKLEEFHYIFHDYYDRDTITNLYIHHTGLSDPDIRAFAEKDKYHQGSYNFKPSDVHIPTPNECWDEF